MHKKRRRMNRQQFEQSLGGDWETHLGDRYRTNGVWRTEKIRGMKYLIYMETNTKIRAYTWQRVFDMATQIKKNATLVKAERQDYEEEE